MSGRRASERHGRTQPPLFPAPRRRVRAAGRPRCTRGSLCGGSRAPQRDVRPSQRLPAQPDASHCPGAAPFRGETEAWEGTSASRDTAASPRAFFGVTHRALQGGGLCISIGNLPPKSSLSAPNPQTSILSAFSFQALQQRAAVPLLLTTFTPIQRPPCSSRRFVCSILLLMMSFMGYRHHHLCWVPPVPHRCWGHGTSSGEGCTQGMPTAGHASRWLQPLCANSHCWQDNNPFPLQEAGPARPMDMADPASSQPGGRGGGWRVKRTGEKGAKANGR